MPWIFVLAVAALFALGSLASQEEGEGFPRMAGFPKATSFRKRASAVRSPCAGAAGT